MTQKPLTFPEISVKYLEPGSIWLMILGIIALCQPLSLALHSYGVSIILLGLIGFNIFSKIKPPASGGNQSPHV